MRELVVGMHLHRKVFAGIDEFYQKREAVAVFLVVALAQKRGAVFVDELCDGLPGVMAVGHYRLVSLHSGYFPAFAYVFLFYLDSLERGYPFPSPDCGLEYRFKCPHVFY